MDETQQVAVRPPARGNKPSGFRAVVVFWLLGAMVLALPGDRRPPGWTSPNPPQRHPEPSPSAPSPSPTVAPGEVELFPASDLIFRAPARLRPLCVPVDVGNVDFETLDCSEGPTRIFYVRYSSVEAMDRQFDESIAQFNLPAVVGTCEAGVPGQDSWHYSKTPNQVEGRMACFIAPPDVPTTVVTQPSQRLLSIVLSDPAVGLAGHYRNWSNAAPNPPIDEEGGAP